MKRLAYLQNAHNIRYEQKINSLWTGAFSLPYQDEKNKYCEPFNFVEIWDVDGGNADRYVGLFRIMPRVENTLGIDAIIEYELEHVLSTLLDDVMLEWHEIGNVGTYTDQVIAYILRHQTQTRWELEQCDFKHQYLYGWQDENLLSALYSVVTPFEETDYYWDFDTTAQPWRLRLLKADPTPVTDVRYKKNLIGLTKTSDPTNLTTRLYCYGYGEGDNKLTIKNVNNGVPYLQSPNADKYGIITQVWTDERFTIEESLKATGEAMLKKLETPVVTYEMDIQTVSSAANLQIGDTVRVVEGLLDELMVVQELNKSDLSGAPKSGQIILGHGTVTVGDSLASIADRQRISEMYSQGAESIFMDSFYDNADASNPSEATFVIPENAVHVNEIRFSAKLTSFRAYSRATQGGGAAAVTSSEGGSNNVTSSNGGGSEQTSSAGGSSTPTSDYGGNSTATSNAGGSYSDSTGSGGGYYESVSITNVRPNNSGNVHNHGMSSGTRLLTQIDQTKEDGVVTNVSAYGTTFVASGDHYHSISIPSHYHSIRIPTHSHTVNIPSHRHTVSIGTHRHTVTIPSHQHTVYIPNHTHTITLPNHVHNIQYGIYKGPTATGMSIYLDDRKVGDYTSSVKNINLIDYMSKNANGNVLRGEHVIRIVPNALTRIEAHFQIRMFTNSRGGDQY